MSMPIELILVIFQQIIPNFPSMISIKEIHEKLLELGFNISYRQLSRKMVENAPLFGAESCISDNNKRQFYYDNRNIPKNKKSEISSSEAMVWFLVKHHLSHFLPLTVIKDIEDKFNASDEVLLRIKKNTPNSNLITWLDKVGPNLDVPNESVVIDEVKSLLYKGDTIKFEYAAANDEVLETHVINPSRLETFNGELSLVGHERDSVHSMTRFEVARITNIQEASFSESFSLRRAA
jgi:predicted DNA-binding transcriptional regulator YafY